MAMSEFVSRINQAWTEPAAFDQNPIDAAEKIGLAAIAHMPDKERWSIFDAGLARATEAINKGILTLDWVFDKTWRGGAHSAFVLHDPIQNTVVVEIPDNGAQIPTMLHGLEIIALSILYAQSPNYFPSIMFCTRNDLLTYALQADEKPQLTIFPLPEELEHSNAVVLGKNIHDNPPDFTRIALAHFRRVLSHDKDFPTHGWRHTIIVKRRKAANGIGPKDHAVWLGAVPHERMRDHFTLFDTDQLPPFRTTSQFLSSDIPLTEISDGEYTFWGLPLQ